jgi:hypothetical protein
MSTRTNLTSPSAADAVPRAPSGLGGQPRTSTVDGDRSEVRADRFGPFPARNPRGREPVPGLQGARRLVGDRPGRRSSVDPVAHRAVSDGRGGTTWI